MISKDYIIKAKTQKITCFLNILLVSIDYGDNDFIVTSHMITTLIIVQIIW
jgi:hypothetical protein